MYNLALGLSSRQVIDNLTRTVDGQAKGIRTMQGHINDLVGLGQEGHDKGLELSTDNKVSRVVICKTFAQLRSAAQSFSFVRTHMAVIFGTWLLLEW